MHAHLQLLIASDAQNASAILRLARHLWIWRVDNSQSELSQIVDIRFVRAKLATDPRPDLGLDSVLMPMP